MRRPLTTIEFTYTATIKSIRMKNDTAMKGSSMLTVPPLSKEGVGQYGARDNETGFSVRVCELTIITKIALKITRHRNTSTESFILLKTSLEKMLPMEREKSQLICVAKKNTAICKGSFDRKNGKMNISVFSSSRIREMRKCPKNGAYGEPIV